MGKNKNIDQDRTWLQNVKQERVVATIKLLCQGYEFRDILVGRPKKTKSLSVRQLEDQGLIGIYERIPTQ